MIRQWKMALYWKLPVFLQEAGLSIYARKLEKIYYGTGYEEYRQWLRTWKTWSHAEIVSHQNHRLREIVQLAGMHVPYYREKWKTAFWRNVHSASDLSLLPRLDKQELRRHEGAFLVEGLDPKSLWVEKTSGSTGTSLRVYWPMTMVPKWWAMTESTVRNVAEVGQDVPRAMMGGRPIVPGASLSGPYWRYNRHWRQLYLSSYHVSRRTAPEYAEAIRTYGSEWITGYPSAIAALAEGALDANVAPIKLTSAIVSGDTLTASMRTSIEQFFQCKCFDSYGQCEGVCVAMECAWGRMHVVSSVGIIEILRDDGSPCLPGEIGEMVATGLMNDAMPLVRYRLGDMAAWSKDTGCLCGSPEPIIESIEGRMDDYLITEDGRQIGRLSTATKRSPSIHSAQIVQDRPGHAYLLVRPSEGYQTKDAEMVREDILERIGDFHIDIVEVSEIPRTAQGKTRLVVRLCEKPEVAERYALLLRGAAS
ncbi:MAG: phenylacetate--CoA ligase family protein [Nitrospira sp.]|nr:phenylacetate--CoA ligase family protein [Nitrospira sp.]